MRAGCPLAWTALVLLASCVDKSGFELVKNTCITSADCADAGARCEPELLQCVREAVEAPYQVVLQVHAIANGLELPEGESLVEQETYQPFELRGPREDWLLEVPLSQLVTGSVSRVVRDVEDRPLKKPVAAELTFVPEDQAVPVSKAIVVNTRGQSGGTVDNLSVRLNPNVQYRVRIQPVVEDSRTLAPFTMFYVSDGSPAEFSFPTMEQRSGTLRDEDGMPLHDHRIRLEDKLTGEVLSSTATVGARGEFVLYAPTTAMAGQSFNIVVSLKPFPLWRVKVAVDGSRLVQGAVLTLPTMPTPVEYQGSVEAESNGKGAPAPFADLIFSSRFPLPEGPGDHRGKDWCRWHSTISRGAPVCSAQLATTTDSDGRFSIQLLPGDYDVFISPSSETGSRTPLSTSKGGANVLTQPDGGLQEGNRFTLGRAIRFEGSVRSPNREPMPNVVVTARPLSFPGPTPDEEVYQYARPAAAITQDRGIFQLDVDLGYFDLTVEPPAESGFAWVHQLNRVVRGVPDGGLTLVPSPPVPVSGQVKHDEIPLPGANVEAFALITSGPGGRRAVRIAQTVSDGEGNYRLTLPPAVREEAAPEDAGVDASHSE